MRLPFGLNRARESRAADFADGFAAGLEGQAFDVAMAGRIDQDPAGLSAALTAASIWSHALAGVTVTGDRTGVVTAAYLASVGRRLILAGEAVDVIETDGDGVVRLAPAVVQEVLGRSPNPQTWRYLVGEWTPDGSTERYVGRAQLVVHHWAHDGRGRGRGPLAGSTVKLAAGIEAQLAAEAQLPSGLLLSGDFGGSRDPAALGKVRDEMVKAMRRQAAKGEPLLVGVGAVSEERAGRERTRVPRRPSELYKATRVGAEPPEALVELRARVSRDVLAACSIPPALVEGVTGQADREAQRQFTNLHARPRGALIAAELAGSLESPGLALDFAPLRGADTVGMARSTKALVESGLDIDQALAIVGLIE